MTPNEITDLEEGLSAGGLEYEEQIVKVIVDVISKKFVKKVKFVNTGGGSAGFSAHGIDLELDIAGKIFNVELKANSDAQMGGTSIRYDAIGNVANIVNPDNIDEAATSSFVEGVKSKSEAVVNLVDFLRKQKPYSLHKNIGYSLPLSSVEVNAWQAAVDNGLLKPLNASIRFSNTDLISKAYNRKGVYYIQIGGAGLFYLGKNPYKLPIPKFEGIMNVEFRLGAAGSKVRLVDGQEYKVRSANYRAQGRLLTKAESPVSLENPADVVKIINHILKI